MFDNDMNDMPSRSDEPSSSVSGGISEEVFSESSEPFVVSSGFVGVVVSSVSDCVGVLLSGAFVVSSGGVLSQPAIRKTTRTIAKHRIIAKIRFIKQVLLL